jgi:hypothetical protein
MNRREAMPSESRATAPKTCFVVAPIGEPDSETRKRSDHILKHVIQPAVKALGYEAVRRRQRFSPGMLEELLQCMKNLLIEVCDGGKWNEIRRQD